MANNTIQEGLAMKNKQSRKSEDLIPSSWFYMELTEKIKLNWFLFEFACTFYEHIRNSKIKRIIDWKAKYTDEQIAHFCAYYAKRMKESIINSYESGSDTMEAFDEFLTDYFHTNTHRENDVIANLAGMAWENLMETCDICSASCLEKPMDYCVLFDEIDFED